MECPSSPGTSQAAIVKEVLENIVEEIAGATLDSPPFSTSPFLGENTTTSSDAVTDQENQEVIITPTKRKRGRPLKNRSADGLPVTPASRKKPKKSDDSEDYIKLSNETPKKKPRTSKDSALYMTSRNDLSGGCCSQKVCSRPKRRYDSPDPFEDDNEEFERVTKKMTAPRKWAIEAFHHATIHSTNCPSTAYSAGLAIVPFNLLTKHFSDIPDAGIPIKHETETRIFID